MSAGLRGFLAALAGGEPASSLFELRPLLPNGRPAARAFLSVGEPAELERRIFAQAACANVFVGVCPRVRPEGHAGAVARAWVLWTDLDGADCLERLAAFRPRPSITVRSGSPGHLHAYWRLSEALSPAHAQRANRRLALALGGDMQATDGARIMRPPGTRNHKHTPPSEVVCTRLNADTFTAAEVVARLPDSAHYRRPPRGLRQWARTDAPQPNRLLGLARVVEQAPIGQRNARLFWSTCRALEHAAERELDERAALDALSMAALGVGLGGVEIRATIASAQRTVLGAQKEAVAA